MFALLEVVIAIAACIGLAYFVGIKLYLGVGMLVGALILILFTISGGRFEPAAPGLYKAPKATAGDRVLGAFVSFVLAVALGALWPAIPIIVMIGRHREREFELAVDRARSANAARDRAGTNHAHDAPGDDTSRPL